MCLLTILAYAVADLKGPLPDVVRVGEASRRRVVVKISFASAFFISRIPVTEGYRTGGGSVARCIEWWAQVRTADMAVWYLGFTSSHKIFAWKP